MNAGHFLCRFGLGLTAALLMVGCTNPYREEIEDLKVIEAEAVSELARADEKDYASLLAVAHEVSTSPLYEDNSVELLVDGPETYSQMLAEIGRARHHVHLETYIFADDAVGERFAGALIEAAERGAKVRLIYDGIGSVETADALFARLTDRGVDVVRFNPPGNNPLEINNRDHRKLLVVDARVAFTGGINISSNYSSTSRGASRDNDRAWRDTHIAVRGPAVSGFQQAFFANWVEQGGEPPEDPEEYLRSGEPAGDALVRVLRAEGGDAKASPIQVAYLAAMAKAKRRIWITQAYFVPDELLLDELTAAVERGVDVRIIVPGRSDSWLALAASRAHYRRLLDAEVRLFETREVMLHAKTAVIDGVWSTVGSSNLDYRSFLHNDEINAVIWDREFGLALEAQFYTDLKGCVEVAPDDWRRRGLVQRGREKLAALLQWWL